jgi:chromosome segregation ATPase
LVVAVVGVAGTLGGALLTQGRADRTKRLELQAMAQQQRDERHHAEQVRRAEHAEAWRREFLDLRRACYISLNTASRQYLTAQVNLQHALRADDGVETCLEELETRRTTHRDSYAEAQMVAPTAVLAVAGATSRHLNRGYKTLKQLIAASPASVEALDAFRGQVNRSWELLSEMRNMMRGDLGVDDADR